MTKGPANYWGIMVAIGSLLLAALSLMVSIGNRNEDLREQLHAEIKRETDQLRAEHADDLKDHETRLSRIEGRLGGNRGE